MQTAVNGVSCTQNEGSGACSGVWILDSAAQLAPGTYFLLCPINKPGTRRYVNTVTGPPSHSAPLQLATPDPSTHKINQNGNFIFTTRRRRKAQLGFLAVFGYFQFAGLGGARLSALLWAGPVPGCGCEV